MNEYYNRQMSKLGYPEFVSDLFIDWEPVKDEILCTDRKEGTGNGTIHIFLGQKNYSILKEEFSVYFSSIERKEESTVKEPQINHIFFISNLISMLGFSLYYDIKNNKLNSNSIHLAQELKNTGKSYSDAIITSSLLKISNGRPYFKQFNKDGIFVSVIRNLLFNKSTYKISLYKNNKGEYAACWLVGIRDIDNVDADPNINNCNHKEFNISLPHQIIYFGAPGTGKSHEIKQLTKGQSVTRTTFHPDSDYSTFVGAYKPINRTVWFRDLTGKKVKDEDDGSLVTEEKIFYEFVPQAFVHAYINAWEKYWKNEGDLEFLVIEEINRGNCAQIFGDLFQLLDRNDSGFSDYPIIADNDLRNFIKKEFIKRGVAADIVASGEVASMYEDYDGDIVDDILNGKILILPNNFYIWATMNTSDQSLFPIDSAFKRRWDWKYVPIEDANKNWKIEVEDCRYDWWEFVKEINKKIWDITKSEDKKLGYFFCKADKNGVIDVERFTSKVLFYLWKEIFADCDFVTEFFENGESEDDWTFDKFYMMNEVGVMCVDRKKIQCFLETMVVAEKGNQSDIDEARYYVKYNGRNMQGSSDIDTFVMIVKEIGVEKVAGLNLKYKDFALLSKEALPKDIDGGYGINQKEIDGYWMVTKYATGTKIQYILEIAQRLKLDLIPIMGGNK